MSLDRQRGVGLGYQKSRGTGCLGLGQPRGRENRGRENRKGKGFTPWSVRSGAESHLGGREGLSLSSLLSFGPGHWSGAGVGCVRERGKTHREPCHKRSAPNTGAPRKDACFVVLLTQLLFPVGGVRGDCRRPHTAYTW